MWYSPQYAIQLSFYAHSDNFRLSLIKALLQCIPEGVPCVTVEFASWTATSHLYCITMLAHLHSFLSLPKDASNVMIYALSAICTANNVSPTFRDKTSYKPWLFEVFGEDLDKSLRCRGIQK